MFPRECKSGQQALVGAIAAGRLRQVGALLDAGVAPDQRDARGRTPLIHAVLADSDPKTRRKLVKMLLRRGAAAGGADAEGRSALSWACLRGRDREVDLMLRHGGAGLDLNRNDAGGRTALFHAASSGSAASVKLMVDALVGRGLGVDVPDFDGVTPLMRALGLGFDVCATILIRQGKASTTVADSSFLSAFDWAGPSRGGTPGQGHLFPDVAGASPGGSRCCRLCARVSSVTDAEFDSCYGSESSSSCCEDGWNDPDASGRSQSFGDDDVFDLGSLSLADFSPKRRPSSRESGCETCPGGLPPINRRPGSAVRRPRTYIRRNTVSGRLGNIREGAATDDVFSDDDDDDDDCRSAVSDQSEMRRQNGFPMIPEGRFSLASRADGSVRPLTALRAQIDKLL